MRLATFAIWHLLYSFVFFPDDFSVYVSTIHTELYFLKKQAEFSLFYIEENKAIWKDFIFQMYF